MKTKLLKLALCAMALMPMGAWADNNVSTTTTWTFDALTTETTYENITEVVSGLYARARSGSRKTFKVEEKSASTTFLDGSSLEVSKCLTQQGAVREPNYIPVEATAATNTSSVQYGVDTYKTFTGFGMLAFNATVKGTIYVVFKSTSTDSKGFRLYHKDATQDYSWDGGSQAVLKPISQITATGEIQSISCVINQPGTVFIGDVKDNCEIYGVKFVPNYTISYNANGGTGSMSANTVASGNNQTLTANSFTKDYYTFSNWTADVDVTIGDATVTAGSAIADGATIQNVTYDIALTAQWEQHAPTITKQPFGASCEQNALVPLTVAATAAYEGTLTYQWYSNTSNTTEGATEISGATEATYVPSTASTGTTYYYCIVSEENATRATSNIVSVVVAESSLKEINKTSTWWFDQYYSDYTVSNGSANTVVNCDGLYFVINGGPTRNISAQSNTLNTNYIDGGNTIFSAGTYMGLKLNNTRNSMSNDRNPNVNNDAGRVSLRVTKAGTLYVLCSGTYSSERTIDLYNGTTKITASSVTLNSDNKLQVLKYTVTAGNNNLHLVTSYGGNLIICGVKFVYGTNAGDESSRQTTVNISSGYCTFGCSYNWKVPTGYTAYYASAIDDDKVTMTPIAEDKVVPASEGVVLAGTKTNSLTITSSTATPETITTNYLKPILALYALPSSGTAADNTSYYNYTLALENGNPVFKHTTGVGYVSTNKAYLRTTTNVTSTGEARGLELVFEEEGTTGVGATLMNNERMNNEYYDLQGRKVAQPTRGLYIVNGKKVIIK